MMFLLPLLFVQAAAAVPDIELGARVRARSVTIQTRGNASLTVTTSPRGANLVDARAPETKGRKTLRNVEVNVRAEARIADPAVAPPIKSDQTETAPPQ